MTQRKQEQLIELQANKLQLTRQFQHLIDELGAAVKTAEAETHAAIEHTKERLSPARYVREFPVVATITASLVGYFLAPRLIGFSAAQKAQKMMENAKIHSVRDAAIGVALRLSIDAGRRFFAGQQQKKQELEKGAPTLRVVRGR